MCSSRGSTASFSPVILLEMESSASGPGRSRVPVLRPADLLLTLDEPEILLGVEQVVAWLRSLMLRTPDIDRALRSHRRPVVVQRGRHCDAVRKRGLGETAGRRRAAGVVNERTTRANGRRYQDSGAAGLRGAARWDGEAVAR